MAGRLITPNDMNGPQLPPEFNVQVNVNGNPTPYPLAVLVVQNEQAAALSRIAAVLEVWRDQQPWFAQAQVPPDLAEVIAFPRASDDGGSPEAPNGA